MSAGAVAGASAASAAVAATIQAVRASGTLVHVEPPVFLELLKRNSQALVVHAPGGYFFSQDKYITTYRGMAFYTKSPDPLTLPADCERIEAKSIWMPS